MRVLSRAWQMLLKGVAEVKAEERALAAAEMVLVRIAYAADLPTPDEAVRALDGSGAPQPGPTGGPRAEAREAPRMDAPRGAPRAALASVQPDPIARAAEAAPAAAPLVVARFEDLIALAAQKRDIAVKAALERDVRLVHCEDGRLDLALEPSAPQGLVQDLSRKLQLWTGRRWIVVVSAEAGSPTVRSRMDEEKAELLRGVRADPLVQAVLEKFPGAEIVGVTRRGPELPAPEALASGEPDDGGDAADAGDDRE
jgi:DNA polymerase-3 subunit gamma/tau